ncbi:hypothetical protein Taro_052510 [Colocasia esculenta]|uniref:Uncharacterized protein n=1 Tax=Colocasia esculenta TaxID=4460 RepID=A0A843XIS6_COLES|nr:hypothetical protein [Colocasia esculenta]
MDTKVKCTQQLEPCHSSKIYGSLRQALGVAGKVCTSAQNKQKKRGKKRLKRGVRPSRSAERPAL